ncbi:FAD binding domain-containing protein [Argonema galeatum]|uniref:FAD binding domain-containing protein n=1 Tax=Argonema galeatum TaxID=2942762 RepID=UPI002012C0F4|nr:FAD binding domain-containing protein [Argonema galeatum]MCL1463232.1 FAD binding domain-containing protein [Argonema galeatum A003/A1]
MDLPNIETYLRPTNLQAIETWSPGWAWLAGGTWLFSEPQPHLKVLVDLEKLDWSEIEVTPEGLAIGATCKMEKLLTFSYPESWTSVKALQSAVHHLASFKVTNIATVGGNICLALPISNFAPVMVALGANYEILNQSSSSYQVSALEFQTGAQKTILQPGEVLRKISIPLPNLEWVVNFKRIAITTSGYAASIVVTAYHPQSSQVRFGLGACFPAPRLIEFSNIPTSAELSEALLSQIPISEFIGDDKASAVYRRQVTQILMQRSLEEILCQNP